MSSYIILKLLVWLALLGSSIYFMYFWVGRAYRKRRRRKSTGEKATAKIIGHKLITLGEQPELLTYYKHQLEFITRAGQKVIVTLEADKTYPLQQGAELTVYYLKEDPYTFYLPEELPYQARLLPLGIIITIYSLYNIITLFFN